MFLATATTCRCGAAVVVAESASLRPSHDYCAHCRDCYGPVIDSPPSECVIGYGPSPEHAIIDWQASIELALDIDADAECPIRSGPAQDIER